MQVVKLKSRIQIAAELEHTSFAQQSITDPEVHTLVVTVLKCIKHELKCVKW
jgi:hypothetical protein